MRIFLDCEFFCICLAAMSFFSYNVYLHLLNCIEKSSQADLCQMFPTLHSDLLEGKTNTLEAFIVKWRHYEDPEPSCELEKLIIQKLCLSAAAVRFS